LRRFLCPYQYSSQECDHSIGKHDIASPDVSVGGYKIGEVMPRVSAGKSKEVRLPWRTACRSFKNALALSIRNI
jgi:hypothetical protein